MADQTAKEYIDRALQKILVRQAGIDVTEQEYTDGIDALNDLMEELDSINIKLGYTVISDKNSPVTVPDWARGYIKARLAVDLASEYGRQIPETLVAEVLRRETSLNRRLLADFNVYFPETLPVGTSHPDNLKFFGNPRIDDADTDSDAWYDDDGTPVEEDAIDV